MTKHEFLRTEFQLSDPDMTSTFATLEALVCVGRAPWSIVAPPHPEYGGSLDNPVVQTLMGAATDAGLGAMAFNYRGVGASTGRLTGEPQRAAADYAAGLTYLRDRHDASRGVVAMGYSFGAVAALAALAEGALCSCALLVAPPMAWVADLPLESLAMPVDVWLGEHDRFTSRQDGEALVARLPRGRLHMLDTVDHFFSYGGYERLRVAVAGFLGEYAG